MAASDASTDAARRRAGYRLASAIVLACLLLIVAWVATGHGVPGGSIWRRATGREGPTGGLTTAMRAILRGELAAGVARHPAAVPMAVFLAAQLAWRAALVVRPLDPPRVWIADLVASLGLFAAAIYLPYALA